MHLSFFCEPDRSNFRLGSLSHLLNRHQWHYRDLPDWPAIPPDPWSRVVKTTPDGTSTVNSESHSPASAIRTSASGGKPGNLVSYDDFFSESDGSTTEDDADGVADDLVEEKIKENKDLLVCWINFVNPTFFFTRSFNCVIIHALVGLLPIVKELNPSVILAAFGVQFHNTVNL
ncbi:hypothetical protein T265_12278 [Opisthorchis viverrini]|uniref:Uncharacterized protein n=1 Tax=Opisthorchis viverrini TaxID=6198 RepID=A0A074ZT32_OPIVI|nr:hypothetical protein T265_12278 [Opisthorchis viverrini]KER18424.1 hypothetical protein T265_12278 [Opisthorchis viverrini]